MRKFLLSMALVLCSIGAMAQTIEFTFTRDGENATVNVAGVDGVTATIAATSPNPQNNTTKTGIWNTGNNMGTDTEILCTSTNTNGATADAPITYTLTISGIDNSLDFDCVTFTHITANAGGEYQPHTSGDTRHCNFILAANGNNVETKSDVDIWIQGANGSAGKDITFDNCGTIAIDAEGKITLKLTLYKGTTNNGCFYGLKKIILTNLISVKKAELGELLNQFGVYIDNNLIGTSVGQYSGDLDAATAAAKYNDVKNFYNSITTGVTDVTEIQDIIDSFNNVIRSYSLNMPEKGKYYRFRYGGLESNYINNYMLSDVYANDSKYLAMGSGESASAIFYYGEDGSLLSYANGRYLSDAAQASDDWTCLAIGNVGNAATFASGKSVATYGFYVGSTASRAYYSGRGTYVDAGGNIAANEGYDWYLEEVTELPVTVTAAGYATLYAPVALTIPTGVKAYTAAINGEWATLTEVNGVIPANTGVVLEGEGAHSFAIAEDVAAIEGNALRGSVATTYYTEAGTYYALAMVENVVGFYKDAFNNDRFQNNSHKAYLYVPEASNVASYSFRFDGTTGVEKVEIRNEKEEIYDLTGRRVNSMNAAGIYIVNGRKVLVK